MVEVVRRKEKEEGGSILRVELEIAMLISTLVILGLRRASKGKDGIRVSGWKMEKGVTYG